MAELVMARIAAPDQYVRRTSVDGRRAVLERQPDRPPVAFITIEFQEGREFRDPGEMGRTGASAGFMRERREVEVYADDGAEPYMVVSEFLCREHEDCRGNEGLAHACYLRKRGFR